MNSKEIEKFTFLSEQLKKDTHLAMIYSKKVIEEIVKDNPKKTPKETTIIGYLNYAASFIASAKSLYYSNFDLLAHDDIEDFFGQFDVFACEVLENISEDHSHQWSAIEFNKLEEDYNQSVLK
ncbi:MAG: hypothetical protein K2I82_00930 [Ruminococcus sp.]|nr:hypothetical protein [Ruminococcus sp.]